MKNMLTIDRRVAVVAAIVVAVTLVVLAILVSNGAAAQDHASSMIEYGL
ncbi:hypothetical protein [Rugosimonospora africana]|uniref:Uncharacterized protein n=1 Tax=Rugosimonospora africana TaxID=556532 RepID=A0A8J3QU90_9ACTN|nr:hypothetical protein [Rugosimonospora africana]GIH17194.1 hypothetical protein Raf01_53660 [Rugosimonospora africana]